MIKWSYILHSSRAGQRHSKNKVKASSDSLIIWPLLACFAACELTEDTAEKDCSEDCWKQTSQVGITDNNKIRGKRMARKKITL